MQVRALAAALLAVGCGPPGGEASAPIAVDPVVARVDGVAIHASELDAPLRLALHDLDRARYELRRKQLRELIATRLGRDSRADAEAARVEVLLEPPEPPRLEVDVRGARLRGSPEAPVTIVEFLDFESVHCGRMQPVLRRLLAEYGDSVRLAVRDLPLPYHRNATTAALAAACAGEQGAYWEYHDALLQQQTDLSRPALARTAARVGLDAERFADCLDARRPASRLAADARQASALGVRTAPTFFVNGLYLKGPQRYEDLARVIDGELGAPRPPRAKSPTDASPAPQPIALPEPDAILDLRRAEIDAALRDRAELERRLVFAPGIHDGRRLLKVAEVRPGDLFDQLGLRAGDVLLVVDGAWVTDLANPLWEALAERQETTLAVLRGPRRQIYRYSIE